MVPWWKITKTNKKDMESLDSENFLLKNNLSISFEEFSPRDYADAEIIANALMLHKSVKLNLQNTVISDRRRIVDFLCGVAYVFSFDIKKVDFDVYEFKVNNN